MEGGSERPGLDQCTHVKRSVLSGSRGPNHARSRRCGLRATACQTPGREGTSLGWSLKPVGRPGAWAVWCFAVAVAVGPSAANGTMRGNGMRGPDYELARITNWEPDGTGMARLSLADGTSWSIPVGDKMYPSARRTIELAEKLGQPIFVSGDRR